uniref:Collagenase NC10/endostatin domain-containing protein n=1 Tax=Oryzias latipes TaxID=8090 RepID=H2L8W1_ORYLA
YETMAATARRHPEGSLVYIIDRTDLYIRVQDGVRQVQVQLLSFLHIIALNAPQSGSMHGLIGVDAMCYKQAQAIKMKGTFRAFLSSRLQDLYSIVHSAQRNAVPIVNLKDEVLFDSWINIFKEGKINENVSIYSFDGKDVLRDDTWPEKMVWHGSSHEGQRNVNNMCESWRVNDQAVTGMAASLLQGSFMQQSPSSCSSSHVVLCIENSVTEY